MDTDLYWQNNDTPTSKRFGDVYFSSDDGLMESRHVYLDTIGAPEIWSNMAQDNSHFTLLENGFGTGLNFIITCHEWLKTASPGARLIYIATEKYPLNKKDIARALSRWPELSPEKNELLNNYPSLTQGFKSRELFSGRIKLLLLIGESVTSLKQLEARVDAVYLDGFAPSCNPDMWSVDLFSEIARLAAPNCRLATFTAASQVRRDLEDVGFNMSKSAGFGKKREQMQGEYNGTSASYEKPWFNPPHPLKKGCSIAIIGAGIAGMLTGLALQKAGYMVTLYDREDTPMSKASGNPVGIIDPYLNQGDGTDATFYRMALDHALEFYQSLDPEIFHSLGLTKFKGKDKIHFPDCGAISPPRIRDILSRCLTIKSGINIENLTDCDKADAIIICSGPACLQYPETNSLPLEPVRGQITLLEAGQFALPPKEVLCGKGYLIPPVNLNDETIMVTGATFSRGDTDTDIREEDHQENLKNAETLWPNISQQPVKAGRCAIRAYSPDHLPLCGPIAHIAKYQSAYKMLKHGPKHQDFIPAPYHPNLYVLSGLGSRGFLAAPLLAEIISVLISGEPLPVPRSVYEGLHPARFQVRNIIKGK